MTSTPSVVLPCAVALLLVAAAPARAQGPLELAREARRTGDLHRAETLYLQVLVEGDAPEPRRELAAVQIDRGSCTEAALTLQGIPDKERTWADRDLVAACAQYAPRRRLIGPQLRVYVTAVGEALALERSGDQGGARRWLAGVVQTGASEALWALYLDLVFAARDCAAYRDALAQADLGSSPQAEERRARCRAEAADAQDRVGAPARPSPVLVAGPTRTLTPGWTLLGLGSALAIGGVALAGVYGADPEAQDAARLGVAALGMGIAGALILGTGIVLVAVDPGDPPGDPALRLELGPGRIGLGGAF